MWFGLWFGLWFVFFVSFRFSCECAQFLLGCCLYDLVFCEPSQDKKRTSTFFVNLAEGGLKLENYRRGRSVSWIAKKEILLLKIGWPR